MIVHFFKEMFYCSRKHWNIPELVSKVGKEKSGDSHRLLLYLKMEGGGKNPDKRGNPGLCNKTTTYRGPWLIHPSCCLFPPLILEATVVSWPAGIRESSTRKKGFTKGKLVGWRAKEEANRSSMMRQNSWIERVAGPSHRPRKPLDFVSPIKQRDVHLSFYKLWTPIGYKERETPPSRGTKDMEKIEAPPFFSILFSLSKPERNILFDPWFLNDEIERGSR